MYCHGPQSAWRQRRLPADGVDSLYGEGQCVTDMAVGMVGQFIRDTITVCWQCWAPCTGRDSVSQVWLLGWWGSSLGTLSLCVGNAGLPVRGGTVCHRYGCWDGGAVH